MKKVFLAVIFVICFIFLYTQIFYAKDNTMILFKTDFGDIKIALYNETEEHKKNFIKLVKDGFYNDLLFHRVIEEFMIQAGDPESKNAEKGKMLGGGGPGYNIPAEILPKYYHKKGALSAARLGDNMNPVRRSSGSQFYLVTGRKYSEDELEMIERRLNTKFTKEQKETYQTTGGAPSLDGQYSVFGEVIEGLETIEKIEKVKTDENNRPLKDIKIISAEII